MSRKKLSAGLLLAFACRADGLRIQHIGQRGNTPLTRRATDADVGAMAKDPPGLLAGLWQGFCLIYGKESL